MEAKKLNIKNLVQATADNLYYKQNGELSAYSFACGYVEKLEDNARWKKMFKEHGHYHVAAGKENQRWVIWEVFDTIKPARKFYRSIKLITITNKKGRVIQEMNNELL